MQDGFHIAAVRDPEVFAAAAAAGVRVAAAAAAAAATAAASCSALQEMLEQQAQNPVQISRVALPLVRVHQCSHWPARSG